jgi:hypothetical protein
MTNPIPFAVPDVSQLARHLRKAVQTSAAQGTPAEAWNHSRWLQLLAKAQGRRNHQAVVAAAHEVAPLAGPEHGEQTKPPASLGSLTVQPPVNTPRNFAAAKKANKLPSEYAATQDALRQLAPQLDDAARLRVLRALSHFDRAGRLLRWPSKRALADMVVWALWMRLDARRHYSEGEITAILAQLNGFGDPVTLRRELVNAKLLGREKDGSMYWKKADAAADAPAQALMKAIQSRL